MIFPKKNIVIILVALVVVIVLAVGILLVIQGQIPKDLSKVSSNQIISMLGNNVDAKDYMQKHIDFKIESKEPLTVKSILVGQNGQIFREVYQGLEMEDNRYMRVDLVNTAGDKGLITVLDFNTGQAIKAYGKILLQGYAPNTNGQTTIKTTN